jgi:hypothetical protein
LMIVALAGFFAVRYFGYRSGWWPTVVPGREAAVEITAPWERKSGT